MAIRCNISQNGVGLIEVLVALLVIAIGLLGLAALQGKAQKAELESYQRGQALILLQDMASRLRANRGVTDDKQDWQTQVQNSLMRGTGCITGSGNAFVVTITWQGLTKITQSVTNPCDDDSVVTDPLFRTMSVPVRFFDPSS